MSQKPAEVEVPHAHSHILLIICIYVIWHQNNSLGPYHTEPREFLRKKTQRWHMECLFLGHITDSACCCAGLVHSSEELRNE